VGARNEYHWNTSSSSSSAWPSSIDKLTDYCKPTHQYLQRAREFRDCIKLAGHADIGARHFVGASRFIAADQSIRRYQSLTI
jgi:hypothetical protein